MNETAQPNSNPETPQAISEVTSRVVDDLYSEQVARETREDRVRRLAVLGLSSLGVLLAGQLVSSGRRPGLSWPASLGGQNLEEQLTRRAGQQQLLLEELDARVGAMEQGPRRGGSALLVLLAAAGLALWRSPVLRQRVMDMGRQLGGAQDPEPGIPDVPMPEAAPS